MQVRNFDAAECVLDYLDLLDTVPFQLSATVVAVADVLSVMGAVEWLYEFESVTGNAVKDYEDEMKVPENEVWYVRSISVWVATGTYNFNWFAVSRASDNTYMKFYGATDQSNVSADERLFGGLGLIMKEGDHISVNATNHSVDGNLSVCMQVRKVSLKK